MQIGEVLRERGWVESADLDRAIAEQRLTKLRLCSLLVARGLIDADTAARALGQQHAVAACLTRHLEARDRALETRIPAVLARSVCALPIGRGRGGELIVCVRDPRPAVHAALAKATGETIMIAVAPAIALEPLVERAYGPAETEFDVDLDTGPIDVPPDIATRMPTRAASSAGPLELDDEAATQMLGALTLVELDDVHVAKDPSQSGQFAIPRTISVAPAPSSAPPAQTSPFAVGTNLPGKSLPPPSPQTFAVPVAPAVPTPSLDATLLLLPRATSRDDATDIAMAFVRGRYASSLLFTIKEGVALGHRGHGAHLTDDGVQAVAIPLATSTIVRAAHDARRIVTEPPPKSAIQDRLTRMLGTPQSPAAAPIFVGVRIACVLVVGDVRDRAHATSDASLDLDDLAVALGSAYARLVRETKR